MSLTTPFRPGDIPSGLVGYWKFNNDATDSSGSGYNLTAAGTPTYTASGAYWKDNYCANLVDSSSQHFSIAHASCPNLGVTTAYTIHTWVKRTASKTMWIGKGNGTTGYVVYMATDGSVVMYQNTSVSLSSGTPITAAQWLPVTITYDGATIRLYVNGNLNNSVASTTDITDNAVPFEIGYQDPTYGAGSVFDTAVWNVALTPLQVKSLALGVDLSKYAYRPNNVSTQPTHWWKLNEVSGNRADSVTTNPLTLTDNGTTLSSGGYVEGVSSLLNGSSQYLSVAHSADFDMGSGAFSLRARIKFTDLSDAWFMIMGTNGGGGAEGFSWRIDPNSATKLCKVYDSTAGGYVDFAIPQLAAGVWYDMVLTKSGTTAKFFIDAVQIGGDQTYSAAMIASATAFQIGYSHATWYAKGNIEDVGVWKGYALTDAEIKSLACALPIQRQGIVSYWKMDEASGNAVDSIGANTGVEQGTIGTGTGKVSAARDLEKAGSDQWFEVANSDSIDIVSDLSMIGWAKRESDGASSVLFDKNSLGNGYGIGIGGGGSYYLLTEETVRATSTTTPAAGAWAHVSAIYTGAEAIIYMNAVDEDNNAYSTNPADTTAVLRLGKYIGSGTYYYDGLMDEFILAKRYFRPEEIKAVYLKGLNGKEVTSSERAQASGAGFLSFFIL